VQTVTLQNRLKDYSYAFNGMEKDDEVNEVEGTHYTTEFRQYDSRVARWLSLDPLAANFPSQSPYVGFDNNPIYFEDPSGAAPEGKGKGKKYQKAITEGIDILSENGLLFGGPADAGRTYNVDYFELNDNNQLRVKAGVAASDAILNIFKESDKYGIDCAEFIQVLHLYAKLKAVGDKQFNEMYNTANLEIGSHSNQTLGVETERVYSRDIGEKYWYDDKTGNPTKLNTGDLISKLEPGARITVTNIDQPLDATDRNQNFIFTGNYDETGNPLFAAHGMAYDITLKEIHTRSALATAPDGLNADEFDAYEKQTVQITQVEFYEEP
jgi:RHS repeat-associated protein